MNRITMCLNRKRTDSGLETSTIYWVRTKSLYCQTRISKVKMVYQFSQSLLLSSKTWRSSGSSRTNSWLEISRNPVVISWLIFCRTKYRKSRLRTETSHSLVQFSNKGTSHSIVIYWRSLPTMTKISKMRLLRRSDKQWGKHLLMLTWRIDKKQ